MIRRMRETVLAMVPLILGTVMGVVFDGLTTMAGFGSLMVAHHKGVWSLGLLLVIGSAATLIASLVVLPTLVHLPGEPLRFPAERQGIRGGWPGWRARGGQSWHPERSQAR